MAFYNSVFSSNIISGTNLSYGETITSSVLSGYNTAKIAVQVTSSIDRISNPLPNPGNNPTYSINVLLYPIGLAGIIDTIPSVTKILSFSGETCTRSAFIDVVAVGSYRIGISNTNSFAISVVCSLTEAKM